MSIIEIPEAYKPAFHCNKRYIAMKGGAGSGKSVFAHMKILIRVLTEEGHRFLAVRKVASTLRVSVFQLFKDLIYKYELQDLFEIYKSTQSFVHKQNGNMIICAGLDDPEKIKSISGITGILIEEATEFTEEDLDQLDLRLRGYSKNYKQTVICFNPISKKHFLKKKFFDEPSEDVLTLTTTYKDNPFLDDEYKRILVERISKNEQMKLVYVDGKWGDVGAENPFYKHFKLGKHIKKCNYDPQKVLHLTFDFNVLPYMTLCVWQIHETETGLRVARKIKEILPESPNNRTKETCQLFKRMFEGHTGGAIVYGDPAGKSQNTKTAQGENDYTIIANELKAFAPTFRVWTQAPPVKKRGEFVDAIFLENYGLIAIEIDESCDKTADEYVYLKEGADGEKLKKKITNKAGQRFEEYGHISDADEYFLTYAFMDEWQRFKTEGFSTEIFTGVYHKPIR